MQLRIPGPTPCPERVLQAMTHQMINHRGKEFGHILQRTTELLKDFFQTQNDVFILTGSGTGGLEAAIVNTLSPGDPVLALTNGHFGERFAEAARCYGAKVTRLDYPWGQAIEPAAVAAALRDNPEVKAVLLVHNETSTGLTNPVQAICEVVREQNKLLLVDGVSSLGSLELRTDEWGIDVAITASQKGWMAPPGLAMLSFSPKAWQAHAQAKMPRFYWDLSQAKKYLAKGQTPFTPAVSTLYALLASLELMWAEGLPAIIERHRQVGVAVRAGIKALGLSLFSDERYASNTVTAVRIPDGIAIKQILENAEAHGVILSPGQGRLEDQILRIGHLGWVSTEDVHEIIKGLGAALPQAGFVRVAP